MEKAFEVRLPQFEGPFDLLLFFIERDEIDVHNIPISKITNDFLDYIRQMNELNIELASEFILVAATLMRIKAKMLLPRPELDDEGNEIDPRKDLVERILQYKQFKEACEDFRTMEDDRAMKSVRGNVQRELADIAMQNAASEELMNLTLFQLLNTFNKVITRFDNESKKVKHKVVQYPYTISSEKQSLHSRIVNSGKVAFTELITSCENKVHAIFTFLAVLELLQEQAVRITLGIGFNNFWLTRPEEEVTA
ncbi:MAG: segregation and condensation protein A [Bacteroidota bacterium]